MILHFSRTSRSSQLPFILLSIPDAYFWLVLCGKLSIGSHLSQGPAQISIFFIVPCSRSKQWDDAPQHDPIWSHLQCPLYHVRRQAVDCYVLPLNGKHLRKRPHLPLYFLIGLTLAPQTREPTAALPNPTAHALRKPI